MEKSLNAYFTILIISYHISQRVVIFFYKFDTFLVFLLRTDRIKYKVRVEGFF